MLRVSAPSATPSAPYAALTTVQPIHICVVSPARWCTPCDDSAGMAPATENPNVIAPISVPTNPMVVTLAMITSRRRGVMRNVGMLVEWRYSPALQAIPMASITIDVSAAVASTWWIASGEPSDPVVRFDVSVDVTAATGPITSVTRTVTFHQVVVASRAVRCG